MAKVYVVWSSTFGSKQISKIYAEDAKDDAYAEAAVEAFKVVQEFDLIEKEA
jgi:hypothetical protein